MNAKLLIGLACLSLGLMACSHDDGTYTEADKLANAEKHLGAKIDPQHDWKMTKEVTASITVNLGLDQQYTVAVYDKNPLFNEDVSYYTRTTVAEGETVTLRFSVPSTKNVLYVGAIDSQQQRVLKTVAVENGRMVAHFEDTQADSRVTRSITVNGDTYDKFPSAEDVAAYFPTAIPGNADEVSQLEAKYKGTNVQTQWGETTVWDIYAIYQHVIVEGFNLKVTSDGTYANNVVELGGNYQNAGWDGAAGMNVAYPYNVYVDVDGDLTIRRVGATHFNLYILRGNVTLESNYGEQAGLISVAAGATLNDQRSSIAANQGVKMFNRGTVNATNTTKYDIGNFCTVYNEGKFNVTGALTYSPADANNSYFMNLGDDAELTAASMTLNSTGNFYNDGKVTIAGETNVTQQQIYWVNAGHYTTGTMIFSAKNATFYNYCQLIVEGNAHMYDGEFNLMRNSYTEAGTAEMDNFIVNMKNNSGMYIKGDVDMMAQADGAYQGFRTSDKNAYLLIGGKVTVASHRETFSISSKITYSIHEIEIIKGGQVVTEEELQSNGDGDYPVLNFNGIGCTYGKLKVTPKTNSCGAKWSKEEEDEVAPQIFSYAFEDTYMCDYDMNDVVLYVSESEDGNGFDVELMCTGAKKDIYVYYDGEPIFGNREVHDVLGGANGKFLNTGAADDDMFFSVGTAMDYVDKKGHTLGEAPFSIRTSSGDVIEVGTQQGNTIEPYGIVIPRKWEWPTEWTEISRAYPSFIGFVIDRNQNADWYNTAPESGLTMSVPSQRR